MPRSCACSRSTSACASSCQRARREGSARDGAANKRGVDLDPRRIRARAATDRAWMRDIGAELRHVERAASSASSIGGSTAGPSTPTCSATTASPAHIATHRGMQRVEPRRQGADDRTVVLEGGGIDVDGAGHAAHHRRVPAERRAAAQPGLVARRARSASSPTISASTQVLWLGRGIAGDDTHGHVDDLARFVRPGVVVVAHETNPRDENYAPLAREPRAAREMHATPRAHSSTW